MLGFHTDGIKLIGAADDLKKRLKGFKLPLTDAITGNTLVFCINDFSPLQKKFYAPSLLADESPWFACALGDCPQPIPHTLHFNDEASLADFILAIYYASQGFLHLDFELTELKTRLSADKSKSIVSVREEDFGSIPKDSFVMCFCFSDGGFMESDRLFRDLTQKYGMNMGNVLLAGTFDSKFSFIRAFVL